MGSIKRQKLKIEYVRIDKIIPYDLNCKNHPDRNLDDLQVSVNVFGVIKPIVIDENFIILAGHGIYFTLLRRGDTEVPVVRITHLSEREKRAYRIADNKLAEKSAWNFDALAVEVDALVNDSFDVAVLGFDEAEIEKLLMELNPELPEIENTQVKAHTRTTTGSTKTTKKTIVSRLGDVFVLGGAELKCLDVDALPLIDWLVMRWQGHTGENAILKGTELTYQMLKDARGNNGQK